MMTLEDALGIADNAVANSENNLNVFPEDTAVIVLAAEVRRQREENERLRKYSPQQSTWQPIAAAPDDKPLIVGWVDLTNTDRYYFDIKQDGVWQDHDDMCEMAEACAPAGSVLPNRNPPYEYFIEIPTLPDPA